MFLKTQSEKKRVKMISELTTMSWKCLNLKHAPTRWDSITLDAMWNSFTPKQTP